MILKFSTKRNQSGNRYFLGIDTEKKVVSRESAHWYSKEDLTAEVTRQQRQYLIEVLEKGGFSEIGHI